MRYRVEFVILGSTKTANALAYPHPKGVDKGGLRAEAPQFLRFALSNNMLCSVCLFEMSNKAAVIANFAELFNWRVSVCPYIHEESCTTVWRLHIVIAKKIVRALCAIFFLSSSHPCKFVYALATIASFADLPYCLFFTCVDNKNIMQKQKSMHSKKKPSIRHVNDV